METKVEHDTETDLRENLLLALDMFDSGCRLVLERLRREYPDLPADAIELKLLEWLEDRPPDAEVPRGESFPP